MVDASLYEYHRDSWPAKELASVESKAAQTMRRAFREAEDMIEEFKELRAELLNDKRLSAVGVKDAQNRWAQQKLPTLAERIETIGKEVASTEAAFLEGTRAKLVEGDDEHGPEIRSWLRSLPSDLARADAIRRLMDKGDNSALRAVMKAPGYLTAIDSETLSELTSEAIKRAEPERHGRLEALRKGADTSTKALSAAITAIRKVVDKPAAVAPRPPAPERPKPVPLDPEIERRIADATAEAIARQEAMAQADADRPAAA